MKATEIHAIDGECLLCTPLFEYGSVLPHRLPVILRMYTNPYTCASMSMDTNDPIHTAWRSRKSIRQNERRK